MDIYCTKAEFSSLGGYKATPQLDHSMEKLSHNKGEVTLKYRPRC